MSVLVESLKSQEFISRFESYFIKADPDKCWEWLGSTRSGSGNSYTFEGHVAAYGRIKGYKSRSILKASRVSFMLYNGKFDENLYICHTCDNTKCVNPNHLFAGTNSDNQKDRYKKGRYTPREQSGELNPNSKLTKADAKEIKDLIKIFNNKEIAKIYNVSHATISLIRVGKKWIDA